jgi:hypothetical protein
MSALLNGPSSPLLNFLTVVDDRLASGGITASFQWAKAPPRQMQSPWQDGQAWARSGGIGGQFSTFGMGGDDLSIAVGHWDSWGEKIPWGDCSGDDTGGCTQNFLVGFTQNSSGQPLGNCKVSAYLTSTGAFINSTTSDTAGYYKIPVPYSTSTAMYVTASLSGSPDVAGMSDNTLTPAATG